MSAFLKTLFGDKATVSVVAIVMAAEVLFVTTGNVSSAAFLIPPLVLAGAAWLAVR